MADISEYTKLIGEKAKGETVRDAIIDAIKIISGDTGSGKSATTLNGGPLEMYVVNRYDPQEGRPFAISLAKTKLNLKELVDKINYVGHEEIRPQTMTALGPIEKEGVNNSHYNQAEFDRLMTTRYQLCEAINEAWRNSPQGAHGSDEYLVLPTDPFEEYPEFIRRIGVGEGIVLRTEEKKDPIVENGTYSAPAGIGYSKVTVNVTSKKVGPLLEEITTDGTYVAKDYNKDGFSFVTVQVPVVSPDDPSYDPEHPYDPGSWSGGGTPETGCTVIFYIREGEKAAYSTHVEYGGTAVYAGPEVTSNETKEFWKSEYWTGEWNPNPVNVTHNMKCYAVFEPYKTPSSEYEIKDPWEVIAMNRGGSKYPVGSWKILDFGTTPYFTQFSKTIDDVYTPIKSESESLPIGRRIMVKVKGADSSNGTTSTWMMREPVAIPNGMFWTQRSHEVLYERFHDFFDLTKLENPETDFCSVSTSFLDSDLWYYLNDIDQYVGYWLPSILKSRMKEVERKCVSYSQSYFYNTSSFVDSKGIVSGQRMKIFPISVQEMFYGSSIDTWNSKFVLENAVYDGPNFSDIYFPDPSDKTVTGWLYYNEDTQRTSGFPSTRDISNDEGRSALYTMTPNTRDVDEAKVTIKTTTNSFAGYSIKSNAIFANSTSGVYIDRINEITYSSSSQTPTITRPNYSRVLLGFCL